jgi:hypothetical protein
VLEEGGDIVGSPRSKPACRASAARRRRGSVKLRGDGRRATLRAGSPAVAGDPRDPCAVPGSGTKGQVREAIDEVSVRTVPQHGVRDVRGALATSAEPLEREAKAHPDLADTEVERVADAVAGFFRR